MCLLAKKVISLLEITLSLVVIQKTKGMQSNAQYAQVYCIPWSVNHSVRELSGFFKDLRGTCLIKRLMVLSLPAPDTFGAASISTRCRSIDRSSLEGSVSKSRGQIRLVTLYTKLTTQRKRKW